MLFLESPIKINIFKIEGDQVFTGLIYIHIISKYLEQIFAFVHGYLYSDCIIQSSTFEWQKSKNKNKAKQQKDLTIKPA